MRYRTHTETRGAASGIRALLWLCALEAALFVVAVGWQKAAPGSDNLPSGKAGSALFVGFAFTITACMMLVRLYKRSDAPDRRAFGLGMIVNLVALVLALAGTEVVLRLTSVKTRDGLTFGRVTLPPTWNETRARNATVMATKAGFRKNWLDYIVSDPDLGWTIGQNRRTPDGMYFSSVEGLRSDRPDVAYAARRPPLRIALVGDSFTFAMDGPFADSWGYQLEQQLGRSVQVLNFGVDGYGVDQAYLRYQRDVIRWHPDIVLFGLIQHDLLRTLAVYPFISFHWDYPFAKPRFAIVGDELRLLNTPLIEPSDILAHDDVSRLPFVDYDLGYQESEWRWRQGDPPLIARLFGAAFRRFPAESKVVSDSAAIEITGRVLQGFVRQAAMEGIAARILYFPSEGSGEFGRKIPAGARIARRMLADYAPNHLDLTSCVLSVPAESRLIPGQYHYSRRTNGKVAECVAADLAAMGWLKGVYRAEDSAP